MNNCYLKKINSILLLYTYEKILSFLTQISSNEKIIGKILLIVKENILKLYNFETRI